MPAKTADVRWEMALWQHADMQRSLLGLSLKPQRRGDYHPHFQQLASRQKQQLHHLLLRQHSQLGGCPRIAKLIIMLKLTHYLSMS
ncbi:hypothetical protein [Candidatus Venteria ishoeyi]|uniref:hypothetical protein n=1 Tax=Candidatus Venteria ishoeyi TaxID=1899563 RepID=UPI000CDEA026|nr:hypothetical protein [Candidatus Venteria ishoeyi]